MSKYFNKNLRYLRNKSGIEQLQLANMVGLESASAVSEWEKGVRVPSAGVLSDLANIFKVSLDNLMNVNLERFNVGSSNPIPLLGTIAAGTPVLAEENIEDYFNIDTKIKADFALRVKGDSMEDAKIFPGDYVFIKKQDCLDNGEIGAILIDNEATLKKFFKEDNTVILQAENDKYKPKIYREGDGNIKILGKLVAVLNLRE